MQITLYTVRGVFQGKKFAPQDVTENDAAQLKRLLQQAVSVGEHFTLETNDGYLVFSPEVLRSAVVVVEN
jgi:hypothetical protein